VVGNPMKFKKIFKTMATKKKKAAPKKKATKKKRA
jgi:hypothetical protein